MVSIVERIGALAGTELSSAVDLAHRTYQDRLGDHSHVGRALVETVAELCRNHPNLVGVGIGLLVEQLLVHEKQRHEAHLAAEAAAPQPSAMDDHHPEPTLPQTQVKNAHLPHHMIKLSTLKPGRVAIEVFGGLLLLKLAATGAKMFRRKSKGEIWFAPAARIRLFSGSIAAYNLTAAARSPKISAWRNGAIFFFGTDALKPLLKLRPVKARALT